MDKYYIYCGGRGSNREIFEFFKLLWCLDDYIKSKLSQKYYKGTDDPLYFPYFNRDLKVCPKVKIPYYYGLRSGNIIFDEFLTAKSISDEIKMTKEYYGEFNYEAHREIEEYNKNLPNWTNEYDPSLGMKLYGRKK